MTGDREAEGGDDGTDVVGREPDVGDDEADVWSHTHVDAAADPGVHRTPDGTIRFAADGGETADDGLDPDTVVVKIGGAAAVDPAGAVTDVAHLVANGVRVIVVHGGSTAVDETLAELGIEPEYVETPGGVTGRFTDAETMRAFTMTVAGELNTDLVEQFREANVDAVGLSGVDGGLLTGPRTGAVRVVEDGRKKIRRGDHSGRIESVRTELLETLLDAGHVPVVTVPMLATDETESTRGRRTAGGGVAGGSGGSTADDGETTTESGGSTTADGATESRDLLPVNADADRAAAAVAGALDAPLVALTDVQGVYADPDDPETLIEHVETGEAFATLEAAAEGFMTRKVMAAEEALTAGSPTVVIGDANVRDPVIAALGGDGTRVDRAAVVDESDVDESSADETTDESTEVES